MVQEPGYIQSQLTVSDDPIGPSKPSLLMLMVVMSLFFAFFGVFVADFVFKVRKGRR